MPVVLERDQLVPPLDELLAEVARLQATYDSALACHRASKATQAGAGAAAAQGGAGHAR